MANPQKVVIVFKIKDKSCVCKKQQSKKAIAPKAAPEMQQLRGTEKSTQSAEFKTEKPIQLAASSGIPEEVPIKRPEIRLRPQNLEYKMKMRPASELVEAPQTFEAQATYTEEDKQTGCMGRMLEHLEHLGTNKQKKKQGSSRKRSEPKPLSPDPKPLPPDPKPLPPDPKPVNPDPKPLPPDPKPLPPDPKPVVVRPSQLEFNFIKDPYISVIGYHEHIRQSVLKRLSFTPNKLYNYGERGSGFKTKGEPQDFYQLRDKCLSEGVLFEDPEFPADYSSMCHDPSNSDFVKSIGIFEWTRPIDIVKSPKLFVDGYSRFDVIQGELGDCWLLAALASLTIYPKLFAQIVPDDQDFDNKYAGIFHFRFWQNGRWIDVVVDDKLPYRTKFRRLLFLSSGDKNEFWSALVEKAYAKLHYSYQALKSGFSCESMTDVTGGVCELYQVTKIPLDFFNSMLKAYERGSLMNASCDSKGNTSPEQETSSGLVIGHAYSLTKVTRVTLTNSQTVEMVRLRNPWGDTTEWNGAWSDKSPEWNTVSAAERLRIGLVFEYDGEFWMSYEDFIKNYTRIEICNLNPDCMVYQRNMADTKRWGMSVFEGEWVCGATAGGCSKHATLCNNPQYKVVLTETDQNANQCSIIIGIMQKFIRRDRRTSHAIGIYLVPVPKPDESPIPITHEFYKRQGNLSHLVFGYDREVIDRCEVPPGTYVVIPCTFNPDEEGQFLLRVLTEKKNIMMEHDNDTLSYAAPHSLFEEPDDEISKLYASISGEDGEVDWQELKLILDSTLAADTKNRGFSNDICRSMIAMMDIDLSGKLNFIEFKKLWTSILHWKGTFYEFDKDSSGTFSGFELREALEKAGFKLNFRIINKLMLRYGNKKGELNFEDFIMCAIKLKTLIDLFEYKARNKNITLEMEEWLDITISAT